MNRKFSIYLSMYVNKLYYWIIDRNDIIFFYIFSQSKKMLQKCKEDLFISVD